MKDGCAKCSQRGLQTSAAMLQQVLAQMGASWAQLATQQLPGPSLRGASSAPHLLACWGPTGPH